MGLKFRFKKTRCTGSYRDRPFIEVGWTTEEGAYSLEDLIAGDLGGVKPSLVLPSAAPDNGNGNGTKAVEAQGVVVVSGAGAQNAAAIAKATGETPDGEEGFRLLDKRV